MRIRLLLESYWKLILLANAFLGVSLLFGMFTDFEFRAPFMNLLFPFLVFGIALLTTAKVSIPIKWLRNLLCLPSIVGGFPYTFFAVLVIINPFTWLLAGRITGVEYVDSYISPNGINVAEVYVLPGANYEMESYFVEVKLRDRFLPLIVRDIYGGEELNINRKDEVSDLEVKWIDDSHLHVSFHNEIKDDDKVIAVNRVKIATPFPLEILKLIFHIG